MARTNYFFERKSYSNTDIKKAYYEYKSYYIPDEEGRKHYPVVLVFGKNEIDLLFRELKGNTRKVFSLYVAEGELNQEILTKKIENYWKMPLWPLKSVPDDFYLEIDKSLLSISHYSGWYAFDVNNNVNPKFITYTLFNKTGNSKKKEFKVSPCSVDFYYLQDNPEHSQSEKLKIEKDIISSSTINFRMILLDFLYELDNHANTFEDENFFKLQPVMQNNKLLDAISRKCRYLDELFELREYERYNLNERLPKKFLEAEKSWLQVCFNDSYSDVFTSASNIFETSEKEAELVTFRSQIGRTKRLRHKYFDKPDSPLRNQLATFFLRQYSLFNAFHVLIPGALIYLLPILLLLIPFGDLLLYYLKANNIFIGFFSIVMPILILVGLLMFYSLKHINLFKLLLPRLSLGILIGWSFFLSSGDLWKAWLFMSGRKITILCVALFLLLFLYIFTDIKNKLIKVPDFVIFKRALLLITFAAMLSLLQGFYVIQIFAEPVYSADYQFLQTENHNLFNAESTQDKSKLDGLFTNLTKGPIKPELKLWIYRDISGQYSPNLMYLWPVLMTQFMLSIIIGVVLQLLWEDRPITEPL